jgi:hypothetical protein
MTSLSRHRLRPFPGVALLAVLLLAGPGPARLAAQLPAARLDHVFPPGGPRGGTTEVAVAGADLDEPLRLHFTHPGITARPLEGGGPRFQVRIGSQVPPGPHEVRFVGRFGISNPRIFVVGQGPEFSAPATNISPAQAFDLPPGATVSGQAAANTVAWYRFSAKAGQRLLIECLAEEIDSRLDATLVLAGPDGAEQTRNRHTGLLDFTAPATGTWLVGVADFLYRGGPDYFYRLSLSTAPRVDHVFPPALLPGTTTNVTVFGRLLPGGRPSGVRLPDGTVLEQLSVPVTAPADGSRLDAGLLVRSGEAALDAFEHQVTGPRGVSNPFRIGLASAPVVLEAATNSPTAPQRVPIPCEVAGQFFPAGDADAFTFEAKKGDALWIEVVSARLGLPTDPLVVVQRLTRDQAGAAKAVEVLELQDSDTNVGDREFNTASRDPAGRFEAPETGLYQVIVRDLFGGTVASPRHVYRLALRPPAPDFRLVAMTVVPKAKADAKNIDLGVPLLRRGDAIPVRVMALRRDGFSGPIELALEDAPPGFLFPGDRLEGGRNAQSIVLASATNAPFHAGPVRLVGRARIGDRDLMREARGGTLVFSVPTTDTERARARVARAFTVGLTDREAAPITVAPATNRLWEVPAGGKLPIPFTVTRRGEFNAAFKLKPAGPGNADAFKEIEVDPKATNLTLTLDLAALKLGEGLHTFTLQGSTTGKYRNNPEGAAAAEAAVKAADQSIASAEAALKKAGPAVAQATQAVTAAATAAKAAAEKSAQARRAAEASPADEALKAAATAADKTARAAAAQVTQATTAQAAAEQARATAEAAVKAAKSAKDTAAAQAKQLNERAKPRDVTVQLHAQPVRVRVLPPAKAAK